MRVFSTRYPEALLVSLRQYPTISRDMDTDVREMFAFVGCGRVWAVANLVNVKPIQPSNPPAFLWIFADFHELETVIECAEYGLQAMFLNGETLEPQHLQSGAAVELKRYLEMLPTKPAPIVDKSPETAIPAPLSVLDRLLLIQDDEGAEIAFNCNERGQVELF